MKSLIVYSSLTGNTRKVADTIFDALKNSGVDAFLKTAEEAHEVDLFDYDLVFIGSPSLMWQPTVKMLDYIKARMDYYRKQGRIRLCSPLVESKKAVVFVTYSGPHTGINEAIPVAKYLGQFCEHLGFAIAGEWYIPGEFHGSVENSTMGKLGDLRGRPNRQDLENIAADVKKLL